MCLLLLPSDIAEEISEQAANQERNSRVNVAGALHINKRSSSSNETLEQFVQRFLD